ncbi:hypothetical protein LZW66_02525 [Campylobacter coli]|nr:hypothetical protein [Campylobacter coli]
MIFENIVLNDLEEISGSHAGGFVGGVLNNENGIASLSNIVLNNIESIKGIGFIGGFAGWINNGTFENIALNNIKNISDNNYAGGFTGVGGKIKCRKRKIKCRIFATNYLSFNLKLKL